MVLRSDVKVRLSLLRDQGTWFYNRLLRQLFPRVMISNDHLLQFTFEDEIGELPDTVWPGIGQCLFNLIFIQVDTVQQVPEAVGLFFQQVFDNGSYLSGQFRISRLIPTGESDHWPIQLKILVDLCHHLLQQLEVSLVACEVFFG